MFVGQDTCGDRGIGDILQARGRFGCCRCLQVVATSPDTPGTMFQEDGKLRYIEGVDNGDAPAHDGTYEAEKILTPREV